MYGLDSPNSWFLEFRVADLVGGLFVALKRFVALRRLEEIVPPVNCSKKRLA